MPVIIKLKGMPWQTTSRDIKAFFRDSKIAEHDIHLAPNEEGKACGVGFACFFDDEDARKAMQRNGAYMGKRYVELFLSSQNEMEKALRDGITMPQNKPGFAFSRGAKAGGAGDRSSRRTSRDRSKSPRDRSRSPRDRSSSRYNKDSRGTSGSYQKSHSPVNNRGNSYNKQRFNGRDSNNRGVGFRRGGGRGRGEYTRGTRGFRGRGRGGRGSYSFFNRQSSDDLLRDTKDSRPKRNSTSERSFRPSRSESSIANGDKGLFLKMSGMPFSAQDSDISQFLKGVNIAAIYIIPNKQGKYAGKSSGSAFVECATQADCLKALKMHAQFMGGRYINVIRCTLGEIVSTLNIDMSLLSGQVGEDLSGGGLGGQSSFGSASFRSNMPSGGPIEAENSASMVAASANINLGDIKDGCVVGLRNLPVSTTPDDILRLFQGFPAIPDSVRIHYIDADRCSGDAMITLVSNERAKVAIRQLSGKHLGGRKIELFLL